MATPPEGVTSVHSCLVGTRPSRFNSEERRSGFYRKGISLPILWFRSLIGSDMAVSQAIPNVVVRGNPREYCRPHLLVDVRGPVARLVLFIVLQIPVLAFAEAGVLERVPV